MNRHDKIIALTAWSARASLRRFARVTKPRYPDVAQTSKKWVAQVVLFCMCCLSIQAYSQEAARPSYKVGDRWHIERFDLWKKEVTESWEHRVSDISASSSSVEIKDLPSGVVRKMVMDADLNIIEMPLGKLNLPLAIYSFPLAVGKKWKTIYDGPNSTGFSPTSIDNKACEVLAFEDVVTKAGTFKAFKIQCDGAYTSHGAFTSRGRTFSTRWYSPEARYWVKHEYSNRSEYGVDQQYVDQMVSYELQK